MARLVITVRREKENVALMRVSVLVDLVTSLGIVALASLLYIVLSRQNKIVRSSAQGGGQTCPQGR